MRVGRGRRAGVGHVSHAAMLARCGRGPRCRYFRHPRPRTSRHRCPAAPRAVEVPPAGPPIPRAHDDDMIEAWAVASWRFERPRSALPSRPSRPARRPDRRVPGLRRRLPAVRPGRAAGRPADRPAQRARRVRARRPLAERLADGLGSSSGAPRRPPRAAPRPGRRAAGRRGASPSDAAIPGRHAGRSVPRPRPAPRLPGAIRSAPPARADGAPDRGPIESGPARWTSAGHRDRRPQSRSDGLGRAAVDDAGDATCRSCRSAPSTGRCQDSRARDRLDDRRRAPTALPSSATDRMPPSRHRAARRDPRHRLLDGAGRPVLHDAPRRPRRRRRQGRATRGRRDPRLGSAMGRATRPPGRGPRRTTSRSTATSAASASTSRRDGRRRSCAGCSRTPTSSSRTSGPAASPGSASTTRRCAAINPRLIHLAISGYGPTGPAAAGPATTSSSRRSAG